MTIDDKANVNRHDVSSESATHPYQNRSGQTLHTQKVWSCIPHGGRRHDGLTVSCEVTCTRNLLQIRLYVGLDL